MMKRWDELPDTLRTAEVRPYYEMLCRRTISLFFKRVFDVVVAALMLLILSPVFLVLALAIKCDSPGPVFYRQERVTRYGRPFRIFKFRTMCDNADKIGTAVTVSGDARITRVGRLIRRCRLDEISQLLNVLGGSMTFVGTRPEVPKYVAAYTPEMMATLLLPAGITSEASVRFKDEDRLLQDAADADRAYVDEVLPRKMQYNLRAIRTFCFWGDIKVLFMTVFAVLGKDYADDLAVDKEA